ncbi:hypothetical protein GCM10025872_30660 [Barrientosiimonas endolithica]|uniref:Pentapeptide repeat-containing protein n=1 Tax=Barrientosiimonas endolithica TaxID=1535208 RepID=A0ABN6YR02_9MICO|nr:hypothetical protein GCM10025872_30660 [Barrientosiimonas endolithica]
MLGARLPLLRVRRLPLAALARLAVRRLPALPVRRLRLRALAVRLRGALAGLCLARLRLSGTRLRVGRLPRLLRLTRLRRTRLRLRRTRLLPGEPWSCDDSGRAGVMGRVSSTRGTGEVWSGVSSWSLIGAPWS